MTGQTVRIRRRPLLWRLKRDVRQHYLAYLMLVPAVVLVFIFHYVPMYGILIAFKNYKPKLGILGSQWNGFQHFKTFFTGVFFPRLLRNTLWISLYGSVIGYPMPVILALLLNEVRHLRYKKVLQTVSYMPYFISTVVICGMLKTFLSYDGLFNAINRLFGSAPVNFLSEPAYFPSIIVWSGLWQSVGWNSIIYMSALSNIDQQLYDAARIDGCGRLRQAWHVTVPGILPTFIILLILGMGSIFSVDSSKILLLYGPQTYETGDVFGTYVYRIGIKGGEFDFSAAVDLCQTVVGFLLLILVNWISRRTTEQSLW